MSGHDTALEPKGDLDQDKVFEIVQEFVRQEDVDTVVTLTGISRDNVLAVLNDPKYLDRAVQSKRNAYRVIFWRRLVPWLYDHIVNEPHAFRYKLQAMRFLADLVAARDVKTEGKKDPANQTVNFNIYDSVAREIAEHRAKQVLDVEVEDEG